ncbi:MAG: sigma-E factor negative regulatory protein [Sulfuriferula sp.]
MHTITAPHPMVNNILTDSTLPETTMSASVSDAMDGELEGLALRDWILSCKQNSVAAYDWRSYHVIGDTLRQIPVNSNSFAEKIRLLVADEPTVLAPQRKPSMSKFIMPVAASVAAICLVSWSALNIPSAATHAPMLAAAPLQIAKIDQTKLANFIAAHRDFSPGSSSPFMDATYQVPGEPAR